MTANLLHNHLEKKWVILERSAFIIACTLQGSHLITTLSTATPSLATWSYVADPVGVYETNILSLYNAPIAPLLLMR